MPGAFKSAGVTLIPVPVTMPDGVYFQLRCPIDLTLPPTMLGGYVMSLANIDISPSSGAWIMPGAFVGGSVLVTGETQVISGSVVGQGILGGNSVVIVDNSSSLVVSGNINNSNITLTMSKVETSGIEDSVVSLVNSDIKGVKIDNSIVNLSEFNTSGNIEIVDSNLFGSKVKLNGQHKFKGLLLNSVGDKSNVEQCCYFDGVSDIDGTVSITNRIKVLGNLIIKGNVVLESSEGQVLIDGNVRFDGSGIKVTGDNTFINNPNIDISQVELPSERWINIKDNVVISGSNGFSGCSLLSDSVMVSGMCSVKELGVISGKSELRDGAVVMGKSVVKDNAKVSGLTVVNGDSSVYGYAVVKGGLVLNSKVYGNVDISGNPKINRCDIYGNVRISGNPILIKDEICDNVKISGNTVIIGTG